MGWGQGSRARLEGQGELPGKRPFTQRLKNEHDQRGMEKSSNEKKGKSPSVELLSLKEANQRKNNRLCVSAGCCKPSSPEQERQLVVTSFAAPEESGLICKAGSLNILGLQ